MTHALDQGTPRERPVRPASRVFSQRLDGFLDQLLAGETPNAGAFCAFCYNPLPRGYSHCDHCGQDLEQRQPLDAVPRAVVDMYRQKMRRESIIVNSFAYLGLALGLGLFLALVAINVLYMEKAFWFFLLATVIFLAGSRLLAGILGGIVGDEIGFRVANRRLAEEWARYVQERETARAADNEPIRT